MCVCVCPQVQVFKQAWSSQGKSVVERLRARKFYPKQVRVQAGLSRPSFIYMHTHIHTYTHTHAHTYIHTHTHTHTHTQLEEVNWRLNLQMAQSSRSKMKLPNALFEFVVSDGEVRGFRAYHSPSLTSSLPPSLPPLLTFPPSLVHIPSLFPPSLLRKKRKYG